MKLKPEQRARRRNNTVFDDDNTQSAIRFLLAFTKAAESAPDPRDAEIREALDYALTGLLRAQYPNGAWPQVFIGKAYNPADHPALKATLVPEHHTLPKVKDYWYFYTFNDNAMRQTILTLLEAHEQLKRPEYLQAVRRGAEFILRAQLPEPQPAWAQQYDFQMRPCWARRFEPPSVCSGESAGLIRTLLDLHLKTGEARYLEPLPRVIAWLKRSQISPNRYARFYEMGTNKPLYFTREYELVYSDTDLPTHYSFQGEQGVAGAVAYYDEVVALDREGYLRKHAPVVLTPQQRTKAQLSLEPRVREVLRSLDSQGRWISKDRIECSTFIRNVNLLCDWMESSRS